MFKDLSFRDVPALIAGITLTSAVPPMMLFGARTTMLGTLISIFYSQGKFEAVDSILLIIPYAGLVEGYLVWKAGNRGKAVFRIVTGFFFGACGLVGLTASNR
ncbi:uncharacterized protein GGS22DRAFT_160625 [Annulohypoxylon maeteangense]|uniref:uncharacterized protein n=1 Tax=Annulohypoxylon maeteangense TaxID=1927788 RepID=UPI0020079AE4|nr:uncharacterized protein GGS22DRAFT_160625 [Annulohypoxylon maeteangense]KAI0886349.1 hypothetical protein GGS22DRAFT_160625 [Annulohypoxylon maeteangense]